VPGGTNSDAYDWESPSGFFPPDWPAALGMDPKGPPAILRGKGGVPPSGIETLLSVTKTSPLWVYNIAPFKDASGNKTNTPMKAARFMTSGTGLPASKTWGSAVGFWELNNEPWSGSLAAWAWNGGSGYESRAKAFHDAMASKTGG